MVEIDFYTSGDISNYTPFAKEVSCSKNSDFSNVIFFLSCFLLVDADRYCITGMFPFNGLNSMDSAETDSGKGKGSYVATPVDYVAWTEGDV